MLQSQLFCRLLQQQNVEIIFILYHLFRCGDYLFGCFNKSCEFFYEMIYFREVVWVCFSDVHGLVELNCLATTFSSSDYKFLYFSCLIDSIISNSSFQKPCSVIALLSTEYIICLSVFQFVHL